MAKLFNQQLGCILIDGFGQRDRHAHFEQGLDQIAALFGHPVAQFLNSNQFRHNDITALLGLCLTAATAALQTLFLFSGTFQRSQ